MPNLKHRFYEPDGEHITSLYRSKDESLGRHRENTYELIIGTLVILGVIGWMFFFVLSGGQG